jgi:hypothetical protein
MRSRANSTKPTISNLIDHVVIVLDESMSMAGHAETLIKQTDDLIQHLAVRSNELGRETRVSIWVFGWHTDVRCIVWDKDVLRLPSIRDFYRPDGNTALIDATMDAINAHLDIPTKHGEHAFLVYVLTDGRENDSVIYGPAELRYKFTQLPDNWTVAALVPDVSGVDFAKRVGFQPGNIDTWDAASAQGVADVGVRIRQTTDRWQDNRSRGQRSTTTLFSTGLDAVNDKTVKQSGLVPLTKGSYDLREVPARYSIKAHVEDTIHMRYVVGNGFYQLSKREEIQPGKQIAIVSKADDTVYVGDSARRLIGLDTNLSVKVKPDVNPLYDIFVQSTSTNRILIPGTRFLYLR